MESKQSELLLIGFDAKPTKKKPEISSKKLPGLKLKDIPIDPNLLEPKIMIQTKKPDIDTTS